MDTAKNRLIYVVEDNIIYNRLLCEYLKNQKFNNVKSFTSGEECINSVKCGEFPDIVIQDYHLEDSTGIEVLPAVKKLGKDSEFIFLTANEDMEVAVSSIKFGAYDYIIKYNDVALKKVVDKINRITRNIKLKRNNRITRMSMIVLLLLLCTIIITAFLLSTFGFIEMK